MYPFDLRDKNLFVRSVQLYESSSWDAEQDGELTDKEIVVRGIVMATRQRGARVQEPYVYIDENRSARYATDEVTTPSGRGFWLKEAEYAVEQEE